MSYRIESSDPQEGIIEYPTMMKAVKDQRVFSVEKDGDGFELMEECDGYFGIDVTPDQLRALGQELIDLADGKFERLTER